MQQKICKNPVLRRDILVRATCVLIGASLALANPPPAISAEEITYQIRCERGLSHTIRFNDIFSSLFSSGTTRLLAYTWPALGNTTIVSASPSDYIISYRPAADDSRNLDSFTIQLMNGTLYYEIEIQLNIVNSSPVLDLFLNPFNRDSAHHRPLGANVRYGIPPGTLNAKVANPTYDAGVLNSRGRLALVRTFRVGSTEQGQKYLHRVTTAQPSRLIEWQTAAYGGGTGDGLPITLRMPAPGSMSPYSDDPSGDNEILLYPRNGGATDLVDVFPQFNYDSRKGTAGVASARARDTYPLGGRDVRDRYNDPDTATAAWGPGAIDWRHPGGFLRGFEVDLSGATPIRHLLNATATRHSRQGATPAQHVLSKRIAYPAWETDRPMPVEDNQGNLPYGTIIAVRWQDRDLRDSTTANPVRGFALNLTPFGKQLFDTFLYFGCCLCDGQGQIVDDAPVLQLRVDWELARDSAKETAVETALARILPHLWPVFNPRRHTGETERHSDGLCYVGGGGPLGPGSVNTAWDALTT